MFYPIVLHLFYIMNRFWQRQKS